MCLSLNGANQFSENKEYSNIFNRIFFCYFIGRAVPHSNEIVRFSSCSKMADMCKLKLRELKHISCVLMKSVKYYVNLETD